MPTYIVSYTVEGEGFTRINAATAEEAKEKFEQGDWESKGDSMEHPFVSVEEKTP